MEEYRGGRYDYVNGELNLLLKKEVELTLQDYKGHLIHPNTIDLRIYAHL